MNSLDWHSAHALLSDPVEVALLRTGLTQSLIDEVEGLQTGDVDDWEFLDHYADAVTTQGLSFARQHRLLQSSEPCAHLHEHAGWKADTAALTSLLTDKKWGTLSTCVRTWVEEKGPALREKLLETFVNGDEKMLMAVAVQALAHRHTPRP